VKWKDVRKIYPDQYVKLEILDFYFEGEKKVVTDVAIIDPIQNPKTATKELLKSKGNNIVYHTGSEKIIIEMRSPTGLRGLRP
jgi:hypothetical protein